ncbi:MAG: hypothetical protein CL902_00930 [Dehalococcoidia bacterium]|nr:hypothetical protein [Dehalococcoidia bacterium]
MFGGPSTGNMLYYWPRVGGHYAELHDYFEASSVDPKEESKFLDAVLSDESEIDVVTPETDLGSLMDFENRSALCFVEEGDPRGDPKMTDPEWFSKEPACDDSDDWVTSQIIMARAALAHTRLEGKIKFFVSGGK